MNRIMNDKTKAQADLAFFQKRLAHYKESIEAAIDSYASDITKSSQVFGEHSAAVTQVYLEILKRGGKRIRGALTILGYEMTGGKDASMILKAALAIEMIHAYVLIIDDFQDQSATRRGGPAAHKLLGEYHKKLKLAKDPKHFGEAMAMNAALIGSHAAQVVMANLNAPDKLKIKALSILNRGMVVTGHGQINDGMNEYLADVSLEQTDKVLEWKTAYYTFLNPLHVGMILAGTECSDTDAVSDYAQAAGRAFQITDDILGIFGDEQKSGKSTADDLREGKRTLLIVYALEHANDADREFLNSHLGNGPISAADLARCRQILIHAGALDFAKAEAKKHAEQAISVLNNSADQWTDEGRQFLRGLAYYLVERQT